MTISMKQNSVGKEILVPFLDLKVPAVERAEFLHAIDKIFESGRILNGPEIDTFEKDVAAYCGATEAVGVGSGTAALYVALRCLGVGPGDEVIMPALSFVGTANAVASVGALPIFVDVRDDLLIDPNAVRVACTSRTRAIMPVHFSGAICDMNEISKITSQYGITLIEDAAPAFGATYRGRKAGSFGEFGCISMNPMKPLGAIGEAGIVLTNNSDTAQQLRHLRYHGMVNKNISTDVSLNARLDSIQASILSIRLRKHDANLARRAEIAAQYSEKLSGCVQVPRHNSHVRSAWYTYSIICDKRDELFEFLNNSGIECKIYHNQLMPEHPAHLTSIEAFPVGQSIVRKILCLPMHEKLSCEQVDLVIKHVLDFYGLSQ